MKKIYLLFIFCLSVSQIYPQKNLKKLVDSLRYVEEVPRIRNCDDPIFWRTVAKGLDIVPHLIDKMTDTRPIDIDTYVSGFGGRYAVADIAYQALQEIIADLPTFELLGVSFDEEGCGYCSYWHHVRKSKKNRKNFQYAVRQWYEKHKEMLVWEEGQYSLTGDCSRPNGGYYRVKTDDRALP